MLSGTQVTTGEGFFLVTVVGENSAIGQIMKTLETEIEATPLQEKLEAIASDIGKLGMYAALLTVHVLYLRFFIEAFAEPSLLRKLLPGFVDDGLQSFSGCSRRRSFLSANQKVQPATTITAGVTVMRNGQVIISRLV